MRKAHKRTLSPRLIEIRARWQQRVNAQRASGIAQTQWCRENGIEPKYFSLWKSKLAKLAAAAKMSPSTSAQLVPVTIRPNAAKAAPPSNFGLTVTLPNGVHLRVDVSDPRNVAPLLKELAGLAC
jgi:hypothetical protein